MEAAFQLGRAELPYVVSPGDDAAAGGGRIRIDRDTDGTVWVGGACTTFVEGTVEL